MRKYLKIIFTYIKKLSLNNYLIEFKREQLMSYNT